MKLPVLLARASQLALGVAGLLYFSRKSDLWRCTADEIDPQD